MSSLDNTKERKLGGSGRDTCKSSLYSYNMMLLVMIYVLTLLLVRGSLHEQSESIYRRRTETEWSKENVQKDKQRSIKHTDKTKYRVTRNPLKQG
jgi:hypothetical protein